jgi:2',3'-cyclic-nucleotide 2'-phosphodiesterase (5'-nucleotidase family)
MQTLLGSLNATKICTNMYHDLGDGKRGELIFQPYTIWNIAGAKIGFRIHGSSSSYKTKSKLQQRIIYTPPEDNLAHYIDVLRNQEQCSYIIIIAHLGLSQQIALANKPECEGVNYILEVIRMKEYVSLLFANIQSGGTWSFGSFIGKLDLTIQNGISDIYELIEVDSPNIKPDAKIANLLKEKKFIKNK